MTLLIFIIVLSVLVLIHELGHFLAARIFGVKAAEFGLGFPPRAIGMVKEKGRWKKVTSRDQTEYHNTIWSLNWLPFGGFVKLKGEEADGENEKDSLISKPIWQRLIVMAAGVGMNWILAAVLFFIVFTIGVPAALDDVPAGATVTDKAIVITAVLPGSPAEEAGLKLGDQVLKLDDQAIPDEAKLREIIKSQGDRAFKLGVRTFEGEKEYTLQPRLIEELGYSGIGVGLADAGTVKLGPWQAMRQSVIVTAFMTKEVVFAFGGLFKDLVVERKVTQDLSGPVGIAIMTGQAARQGIVVLLQFAAILSLNLAVINFLPIPALDGGRAVFLAIEKIRRKPISRKLEVGMHNVVFILLIALIILITARDLFRYGGTIWSGVRGLVGM
ncbi:MAG: M50 family metallopeptidase [Patescibacteria group bacterium]|nr:M50 family metallopeptidase [Patescibacteria group bacterium]